MRFCPRPAPTGDRLAFTRVTHDETSIGSSRGDPSSRSRGRRCSTAYPQFSPDGRRIAFCSLRSGDAMEVWVANADGSSPEQLTHGPGRFQGCPSWSPDGRRIAFESAGEQPHIWTVDSEGGTPRQITNDPGDQMSPTWSRDGEWIYFSWSQALDDRDIWRTRVANGTKERVTRGGGFVASESVDGRTLLYISKVYDSPLMAQPLAGGAPRQIIACVAGTAFCGSPEWHLLHPVFGQLAHARPESARAPVGSGDGRGSRNREAGEVSGPRAIRCGFAVSPDGRTILYGRLVRDDADLMMIENFR